MIYNHTPILCNDILKLIDRWKFAQFTGQHKTDKRKKSFSTWQLFLWLFIGQITNADSLRDLCTILWVRKNNQYHLWLTSFSRSTFSDRLAKTDSSVFENMFYYMVHQVKNLSSHSLKRNDDDKVYAIDSSLISLTLSIFERAPYRQYKWAIKLHTRTEVGKALPELVHLTDGKIHDSKKAYDMISWLKTGDTILVDRWYLDYKFLYNCTQKWIRFVTRTKKNTEYVLLEEYENKEHPEILLDWIVEFIYPWSSEKYPKQLRVVRFIDTHQNKEYEFLTNITDRPAIEIAALYKRRWEIETLFKRMKQNLKIKQFFGTSKNAVHSQIRVALIYYLLLVFIKLKTKCNESLLELTRKIAVLLFGIYPNISSNLLGSMTLAWSPKRKNTIFFE